MPEYLAPGVYVEEVDRGPQPIEGVSTTTTGMVGVTKKGPTDGLPVLVTSFADFRRKFGGYFDFGPSFLAHRYLPLAVDGFFTNGGKRLYIKRVVGTGAGSSTVTAQGGLVTRLDKDMTEFNKVTLKTLRNIDSTTALTFIMKKDGVVDIESRTILKYDPATREVTLSASLSKAYEAAYTIVKTSHSRPNTFAIKAANEGSWGDGIDIRVQHESSARAKVVKHVAGSNVIQLTSTAGFYNGAWVEIDDGIIKKYGKVASKDGSSVTLAASVLSAIPVNAMVTVCEFGIFVSYEGVTEAFSGLTLENIPGHYYGDIINNSSKLITIAAISANTDPLYYPSGDDGLRIILSGGSDGSAPVAADYKGDDGGPGARTGLQALQDIDDISIIAVPGIADQAVQDAMIAQCSNLKYRFAILDPKPKTGNQTPDLTDVQTQRGQFDTKYAALYYPRLMVRDPLCRENVEIPVPPSGHMAGIYARTDIERGVHKAPANEVVRGISGLELTLTKAEQEVLNPPPNHINVIRDFRGYGRSYRVWGARCITSESSWKYINVRRLFIFIEKSIERGTQWVVFEPNDHHTWARVRQSVENFLVTVWRDGGLQGRKVGDAFYVKCDETTMTQTDIDNGKLIMEIGIAPVKPAEFVIFRIGQWTAGSNVEEV